MANTALELYREPGRGASQLERLAEVGRERKRDIQRVRERALPAVAARRLALAFDRPAYGGRTLLVAGGLSLAVLPIGVGVVGAVVAACVVGAGLTVCGVEHAAWRRRAEHELDWPMRLPFPVSGYPRWLASEHGAIVAHLRHAANRRLVVDAIAAVEPFATMTWAGDRTLCVCLPSRRVTDRDGARVLVGDTARFHVFADQLLRPLHDEYSIERLEMYPAPTIALRPASDDD